MKNLSKWHRYFVFVFVMLFFVVPPIFVTVSIEETNFFSAPSQWQLPAPQIARALFMLAVFMALCRQTPAAEATLSGAVAGTSKQKKIARQILWGTGTLGVLLASSLFFAFATRHLQSSASPTQIALPQTAPQAFFCAATFLSAATYEEILYRFYLPQTLERDIKLQPFACRAVAVILFALAHRYLGLVAVANAAVAGAALLLCAQKTRSPFVCSWAHFAYNMLLLWAVGV